MGYQTWGRGVLEALLASRHEIPLVLTHPESDHAYESIWNDSVAELASDYDIPVLVRVYANDDQCRSIIASAEPDIIVSSNWRTWVSPEICQLARYGAINVHDGLLPRYGGFAPLNWALINDEKEVGVTVHAMTEELDLGPILLQRRVPVGAADDIADLFRKTMPLFPEMILRALESIEKGDTEWTEQDPTESTFFHKRSAEDGRICWLWPARRIVNLVRAQADPYPNAFCYYQGQMLRMVKASVSSRRYGGTAGRIFCREGTGVVIVSGPCAHTGKEFGTLLEVVRTSDGEQVNAVDYFVSMGGYLTSRP